MLCAGLACCARVSDPAHWLTAKRSPEPTDVRVCFVGRSWIKVETASRSFKRRGRRARRRGQETRAEREGSGDPRRARPTRAERGLGICSACHTLRRIVSAWMPRMASANASEPLPRTACGSVFFYRLYVVGATRWSEPAVTPENGAQENLIQAHKADQNPTRKLDDCSQNDHRVKPTCE
jgi:hypothetical protein